MYKQQLFMKGAKGIIKCKGTLIPTMSGSGRCGAGTRSNSARMDDYLLSLVKGVSLRQKQPKKPKASRATGGALKFIR